MSESNHAIVFGASGLLGWSVVNELLSDYPKAGTFSKVTAVVNRTVALEDLRLPEESSGSPKLQIASGVNILKGDGESLAESLKGKVADVESITHVFYFVFSAFNDDHIQECKQNCGMIQRVADAMNILAPGLKSFVYSGGTRGYGIYAPGGTFKAPLEESLADQLSEDYAKTVAYPWFRQILSKTSNGRWSWTEVCPDAVVGFSPNGSGFSLALHWAQYLSLYAHNHGIDGANSGADKRVEVPFPGSEEAFNAKFTPVSSRILGRISVHVAMNPKECGGKVVNQADSAQPTTFAQLWPAIASWFGLVGTGPVTNSEGALKPGEYTEKHKNIFEEKKLPKALSCGVGAGSGQLDLVGYWLTFDRQLSLDRLRSVGFDEERDPKDGWLDAFERLRAAEIIL